MNNEQNAEECDARNAEFYTNAGNKNIFINFLYGEYKVLFSFIPIIKMETKA